MNRCSLCPGDHNCVGPSGPENSPMLFLGEGPGPDEDRKGIPFVGKTGREVNEHYLPLAGLRRDDCRFDNTMKCMPKGWHGKMDMNREADRELARTCFEAHVVPFLMCNQYTLIVAMGAVACMALDENIQLDLHHGFPVPTKWGTVFPMYHPAGGIHEPKKMLLIRNDWVRLRKYLRNKLRIIEDEFSGAEDYREITDAGDLRATLGGRQDGPLSNDTESTGLGLPYCLTYTTEPGAGYLIRAERLDLLDEYQRYVSGWRGPILWHNWPYDYKVTRKMGLNYKVTRKMGQTLPRERIVDTMMRSFHLGNLPQGLKALALRECGMIMEDFDDLVTPYSTVLGLEYIRRAYGEEWPKPPSQMVRGADGQLKEYKPHGMKTKFKTFFTYYRKAQEAGRQKDIFAAWDNWEEEHTMIQEKCGRWPGKCITHAPFEKVVKYACRDADATLRVFNTLQNMRRAVRRTTQENWGDWYASA